MPNTCCVFSCKSNSDRSNGISFHNFPDRDKSPHRFKMWLLKINRDNFQPSRYSKVCSRHFREGDFTLSSSLKKVLMPQYKSAPSLKPGVIPSQFLKGESQMPKKRSSSIYLRKKIVNEAYHFFKESDSNGSLAEDLKAVVKEEVNENEISVECMDINVIKVEPIDFEETCRSEVTTENLNSIVIKAEAMNEGEEATEDIDVKSSFDSFDRTGETDLASVKIDVDNSNLCQTDMKEVYELRIKRLHNVMSEKAVRFSLRN